jgi:hypothetical protein
MRTTCGNAKLSLGTPRRFDDAVVDRLLEAGHATDRSMYARSLGYAGSRRVVVLDGKVITHRRADWFLFCEACRRQLRRRQKRAVALTYRIAA